MRPPPLGLLDKLPDSQTLNTRTQILNLAMRGRWRDEFIDPETGVILRKTDWCWNQIQNAAAVGVAALLGREDDKAGETFWGLKYLAIGSGDVSWDAGPPAQPRSDVALTTEYFRKEILTSDIAYIDAFDGSVQPAPTRFLRVTVTLLSGEANGTMREFALYIGDATVALDSGTIFNWVIHGRIDKTSAVIINRTIEIEIAEPT